MDHNVKLDLAEDRYERDPNDMNGYEAIVRSLMFAELATQPKMSFAVAALCQYNSHCFTTHLTAGMRVLQYHKWTGDFQLHFAAAPLAAMINSLASWTQLE